MTNETSDVDRIIADAVAISTRLGLIQPDNIARKIRSALTQEGYLITPDTGWEYNIRGHNDDLMFTTGIGEEKAKEFLSPRFNRTLVYRRPATGWEPAS